MLQQKDWRFSPTEPLLELSKSLGASAPDWAAREQLDKLVSPRISLGSQALAMIKMVDIARLVDAYGEALELTFTLGNEIVLQVNVETSEQEVTDFHEATRDAPMVEMQLRLDKVRLADLWFGGVFQKCRFPNRLILYLFPERLADLLCKSSLPQLQERLWNDHHRDRSVLLVPGEECYLYGRHLLVIGGQCLAAPPAEVFEDRRVPEMRLMRVHQQCQDALKWQTQLDISLTPWHFHIEQQTGRDVTAGALRAQFTNLFLMYTADRTVMQADGHGERQYQASYSSPQQTVQVPLARGSCAEISNLPQRNFDTMLQLFEWAYDPQLTPVDRLIILQLTAVDALRGAEPQNRYRLLVENAPSLLDNTQWHWKAFARERVDQYWEQINDLESYLAETVKSYSDRMSEMASKLTETVLAAVGVLLGSTVAALFQGDFNANIFRLGLITYALYVLFFPLYYNMKNQWESYQIAKREFEIRTKKFEARLPTDKAKAIVVESTVDENAQRFERWFKSSTQVYVVLIAAALLAAFLVPIVLSPAPGA